jgi:hypothetical protein
MATAAAAALADSCYCTMEHDNADWQVLLEVGSS